MIHLLAVNACRHAVFPAQLFLIFVFLYSKSCFTFALIYLIFKNSLIALIFQYQLAGDLLNAGLANQEQLKSLPSRKSYFNHLMKQFDLVIIIPLSLGEIHLPRFAT